MEERSGKTAISGWGRALVLALAVAIVSTTSASSDVVVGGVGSGPGQYQRPEGAAVDASNGFVFVADTDNNRIDVFDAGGAFARAFGWGVVASGPDNAARNERQEVSVGATGGSFALLYVNRLGAGQIQQETGPIPFNATAAEVEAKLTGLPSIEAADVEVSGAAGGPWTVEFTGALADASIHELERGGSTALTGGSQSVGIETVQEGGNYEVCEPVKGDVCRGGQPGPLAGQLNPVSVAVDPASHDVYVFDGREGASYNEAPNNRVQKFTVDGEFVYMLGGGVDQGPDHSGDLCTAAFIAAGEACGAGSSGNGEGEFASYRSTVAVGPGGVLYVGDGGRVQRFEPSGAYAGQSPLPGAFAQTLAVDSAGNLYAATVGAARKYSPAGAILKELPSSNPGAVGVDSNGDLYVSDTNSGPFAISRYNAAGTLISIFYGSVKNRARDLDPYHSPTGDIYAIEESRFGAEGSGLVHVELPPPGPVVYPNPEAIFAAPIGNVRATLHSEINPEGKPTTYHFEYVDQKGFEENEFSGPTVKETSESGSVGTDFTLHSATTEITGLTPQTIYHFRAVATNADGENPGSEGTFETQPPVVFGETWSSDVGADTAALHGEVNPLGSAAGGYFEYVDDATYLGSLFTEAKKSPDVTSGATPIDFGSSEEQESGSAQIQGLAPGTRYHYRLIVVNHCKAAEPQAQCVFSGPEQTFTTFAPSPPLQAGCPNSDLRPAAAAFLLDCRGYEMVSPVDKNGADVEVVFNVSGLPAGLDQSSPDGQVLTYSAYRAFPGAQSSPYTSQYIAARHPGGWVSEPISPPRQGATLYQSTGLDYQFKAFTEDLCSGWPLQDTDLSLAPGSVPGYPNLYRRDNCDPGAGGYEALTTVKPPKLQPRDFFPELQGFSADGSKAIFVSKSMLTEDAKKGISQVYEAGGGQLKLVCLLPGETPSATGCSVGTPVSAGTGSTGSGGERSADLSHAVSDDGSRIYWSQSESGPGRLYVRVGGSETTAVSETVSTNPAQFWTAARDGSRALFSIGEQLYEFDLASSTATLIAGGFRGIAGTSGDATRIYFVSTQALANGATPGSPNLYLSDGGAKTFVATLAGTDLSGTLSPVALAPIRHTSRVTADGRAIAFMSKGRLTGYDNTDAASGEADAEVYLFDATVPSGSGQLVCVSCNPSGARPAGRKLSLQGVPNFWVAASIPTWENQLYGARVLSDDGSRVFFNSFEGLTLRDGNQQQDVYEWEAVGAGNCSEGSPGFQPAARGCVALISSGESGRDSELVDMGSGGEDVFFRTESSLVPQDPDLVDIYDARVNGGFPPPPAAPSPCQGEACQSPPPPPGSPSPASAHFVGPGSRKPPPRGHCVKRRDKGKARPRKHCAKGKAQRHGHKEHRRAQRGPGR
jgi:DNA-binding beta-propeller fold protein YncE